MEGLYGFLEGLPFEMFQYDFMKNAFLAVIFLAPIFALLGTMTVNNKMAFFSDALGHSGFTGIGIGSLLGMENPLLAMIAFGIFLGFVITKVKASNLSSTDTIISVVSSGAMALGIVILSFQGGFAQFSSYMVGDILTISQKDLWLILIMCVCVYAIWVVLYNPLLFLSVSPSLASSRGVKVFYIETIFVMIVAVVVMVSIPWLGILMMNSLLILPAAAARNITATARSYHWVATAFSLIASVLGLSLSYAVGTSPGAGIVLVLVAIFFITYSMGKKKKG